MMNWMHPLRLGIEPSLCAYQPEWNGQCVIGTRTSGIRMEGSWVWQGLWGVEWEVGRWMGACFVIAK